jgi:hypothetical protein
MPTLKRISAFIAVAVAMSATTAFAQRDAGAKMSGQFGTGFYTRSAPTYRWTPRYVAPAPVVTRTAPVTQAPQVAQAPTGRRSFSVDPNAAGLVPNCVAPSATAARTAPAIRRSFSYEPTPQAYYAAPVYRGMRNAARVPSYMLPKTDPGKFGR